MAESDRTVWTIGHSARPAAAFLRLLLQHDLELLVDVRAQPGSRRSPQFDADEMPRWLGRAGIDYLHLAELGGRRTRQDVDPAINAGWQNRSFHNYADYTLTPEYRAALDRLQAAAAGRRLTIVCSEAVPWRCHRLLISNCLVALGWAVQHLIGDNPPRRHELGQWGAQPAVADDRTITYPGGA